MEGKSLNRPVLTTSNPSSFLRDRLREDSNYELDWLWAAGQVTALEEIRYCLARALYINPHNHDTRLALWKLPRHSIASETQQIEPANRIQPSSR